MRKKLAFVAACGMLCAACVTVATAHSGGTDGKGGHWNHSTGEYHYHHGYSAHQHINGICPYDFEDKTGSTSGSSSGGGGGQTTKRTLADRIDLEQDSIRLDVGQTFQIDYTLVPEDSEDIYVLFSSGNNSVASVDKHGLITAVSRGTAVITIKAEGGATAEVSVTVGALILPQTAKTQTIQAAEPDEKEAAAPIGTIVFYIFCAIVVAYLATRAVKNRIAEKKRKDKEREEFIWQKALLTVRYEGKTIDDLAPIPNGFEIGADGLPKEAGARKWGRSLTVFVSQYGSCYHQKCGCSGSRYSVHILRTAGRRPCSKCCGTKPPNLQWFFQREEILKNCGRYGVVLEAAPRVLEIEEPKSPKLLPPKKSEEQKSDETVLKCGVDIDPIDTSVVTCRSCGAKQLRSRSHCYNCGKMFFE